MNQRRGTIGEDDWLGLKSRMKSPPLEQPSPSLPCPTGSSPEAVTQTNEKNVAIHCGGGGASADHAIYRAPYSIRQTQKVWFGMPEISLAPGESGMVIAQPRRVIRPMRLVVDPDCASYFYVLQIYVGKDGFLDNEPIPGTLFPPIPVGLSPEERKRFEQLLETTFHTCCVSQTIRIDVARRAATTNDHEPSRVFRAAFDCLTIVVG